MDIDETPTPAPDRSFAVTRRTALVAGLAGAGALTLAACSSSGSDSAVRGADSPAKAPAGGGSADSTTPAASSSSSAASSSASSSSAGGSATALAELDKITVGEAVSAQLDGKPVIVARPTSTTAACFSAICTHQGCTVKPAGKQLDCPCHGSVYNAITGAVIQGPAPSPLPKVNVKIVDGNVVPA